jgi:(R)-2-hydroxyacyl-CoA dehydratese activating ATPase
VYWGVDIGSTYTKLVALDGDGEIVETHTLHTLVNQDERVMELLDAKEVTAMIATGYGRDMMKNKTGCKSVSEIQAHAKGAYHFFETVSLVIDLGGQDAKVIQIEKGQFVDFRMNDKCAAGTGKFLEIAAGRLGYTLEEFGVACQGFDKKIEISSMCAVFAESELISLMAKKESPQNIGAGVHYSVGVRLANMAKKYPMDENVVFTGGGALNPLLKSILEEELGITLLTHPHPQLNGAIGAAKLALGA